MKVWLFLLLLVGCTKIGTQGPPVQEPGPSYVPKYEWSIIPRAGAPTSRKRHTAVWTGKDWIIWGGTLSPPPDPERDFSIGASFNPDSKTWSEINGEGAPGNREGHSAIWDGSQIIIWGGSQNDLLKTGFKYHWESKKWSPIKTPEGILSERNYHGAVWTGEKMFIWGGAGQNQVPVGTGAQYNPATDEWEPLTEDGAPSPRWRHSLTLAGRQIYIWGGLRSKDEGHGIGTGAIYDLDYNTWTPMTPEGAPSPRGYHSAVYGRKKVIIWGGIGLKPSGELDEFNDGAIYDLKTKRWNKISTVKAPSRRKEHSAVWIGKKMLIWGGNRGGSALNDGALYDPDTDTWEKLPSVPAGFSRRWGATSLFTGDAFIVWGGVSKIREEPPMILGDGAILTFPPSMLE